MDQEYMTKMATSFLEELSEIEKQAGILSAIPKMLTRGGGALKSWAGAAKRQGIGKVLQQGGQSIKRIYQHGAAGGGGVMGGLKRLAASPYGAAAGTVGLGGLTAYGGYKALGGGQHPQYR